MTTLHDYTHISFNNIINSDIPGVHVVVFDPRVPQHDTVYIDMGGAPRARNLPSKRWEGRLNNEYIRVSDITKIIYDPGAHVEEDYRGAYAVMIRDPYVDLIFSLHYSKPIRLPYTSMTFTIRGSHIMGIVGSIVKSKAPINSLTLNLLAELYDNENSVNIVKYPEFWYSGGYARSTTDESKTFYITSLLPRFTKKFKFIRTLTINGFTYEKYDGQLQDNAIFGHQLYSITNLISLRELRIQDMPIGGEFFAIISLIPTLSELSLNRCTITHDIHVGTCSTIRLGNMTGVTGSFMSRLSANVNLIILDNLPDFDYTNLRHLANYKGVSLRLYNMPTIPYNALYDARQGYTFYIDAFNTEREIINGYGFMDVYNGVAPKIEPAAE